MKAIAGVAFCLCLPLIFCAQNERPVVESKAAAERAFDAVISVDKDIPTNQAFNESLAEACEDMIDNLDELKDLKKIKALRAMKKYMEDNLDGVMPKVLDGAAKAAKKAVSSGDKIEDAGINDYIDKVKEGLAKALFDHLLTASFDQGAMPQLGDHYVRISSTGRTSGHIGNMLIVNVGDHVLVLNGQNFYIPSDGRFQSYVGSFPSGTVIRPGERKVEPIYGYCTDIGTPPVPSGDAMNPDDWVVVEYPVPLSFGRPVTATGAPLPVVDPGEPLVIIDPIPQPPVKPFSPDDIGTIMQTPGFVESPRPDPDQPLIIVFPGTDIPIGGTIDVDKNPEIFAPIVVEGVRLIDETIPVIQSHPDHDTPFSGDPVKEAESIGQQLTWIFTAILSGRSYGKEDFADKVYEQFESSTGTPIITVDDEDKKKIDQGVDDFWGTFTAVGIEAKVIRETTPSPDAPDILIQARTPRCDCEDITFSLLVKRSPVEVVHSGTVSVDDDDSPTIEVEDFELGDEFDIEISDIEVDCDCNGTECEFYPAESENAGSPGYTTPDLTKPGKVDIFIRNDGRGAISENSNCSQSEASWNSEEDTFSFKLTTSDENTNVSSVFQRLQIKAYCQVEGCRKKLCKETVYLNFVVAPDDEDE